MSALTSDELAAQYLTGFGGTLGGGPNGIPICEVPYDQALTNIVGGSFFLQAPAPGTCPQEATSNAGAGDHHIIVVQHAGGTNPPKEFDLYADTQNPFNWATQTWTIAGDAYYGNITAYNMLSQDAGSADAAGVPLASLLYNYADIVAGAINGVKRFTLVHTGPYIWPATNKSTQAICTGGGGETVNGLVDQANPPRTCPNSLYPGYATAEGTIFRIKASVYANPPDSCLTDAVNFPQASIIFTGLKQFGNMVADNGGSFFDEGIPDYHWNDADLACLKNLHGGDFEPVTTAYLQAVPDGVSSYQVLGSHSDSTRHGLKVGTGGGVKVGVGGAVKVSQ
jgi:hypothetical protein